MRNLRAERFYKQTLVKRRRRKTWWLVAFLLSL
jgi:hypothetical protein